MSVCGAIGVMQKEFVEGAMIGPPAAREYAVDPVGVATITPWGSVIRNLLILCVLIV